MENVKKKLNKLLTVVVIVLAVVVIALAIKILNGQDASIFGFKMYHILTGSMEPTIRTGSDVVVKSVDPDTLEVGDIISFVSRDDAIYGNINTHRIIGIETDESGNRVFVTKGDANNAIDTIKVRGEDIKGKVVLHLNMTEFAVFYDFLHTGYGFMTVIAFPLLLISWQFLKSFKAQVDEITDDKKKPEENRGSQQVCYVPITEEQLKQMNLRPVTKEEYDELMKQQAAYTEQVQTPSDTKEE